MQVHVYVLSVHNFLKRLFGMAIVGEGLGLHSRVHLDGNLFERNGLSHTLELEPTIHFLPRFLHSSTLSALIRVILPNPFLFYTS